MYLLDSNILLRLILNDQPNKTERCLKFIVNNVGIHLQTVVIFECFQILIGKRLQYSKVEAAFMIETMLSSLQSLLLIQDLNIHIQACELVTQTQFDYVDCYLAAYAQAEPSVIVSYDSDFKRIPDLNILKP